jgi:diaminopimelate epimerase
MESAPFLGPVEIEALCRRNTGIGADGVIFAAGSPTGADAAMRIFNADGSEAEMCGNGIRCLAKYLYERKGVRKESMYIDTPAGTKSLELKTEGGRVIEVDVDMGLPDFTGADLPASEPGSRPGEISISLGGGEEIAAVCLSMGNPHCVTFVDDAAGAEVSRLGPLVEHHRLFPNRANVEFAQILDPGRMLLRVWERGVGETAACGTGACAAFAASLHSGKGESPMLITLRGGDLKIRIDPYGHICMAGPAVEVYAGELNPHWRG